MLEANQIQKYNKKSISSLILLADKYFRKWVRDRDVELKCISCDSYNTSDASHFYSAGNYPALRFNPDNVHLSCKKCNMYLSGNLIEYRKNLITKIGLKKVEDLDNVAAYYKRCGFKWDRFLLIEIILKFKNL